MTYGKEERLWTRSRGLSRREMMRSAVTLSVGAVAWKGARGAALSPGREMDRSKAARPALAFVGTYSTPVDGAAGNGEGIYLFALNRSTGELTPVKLAAAARNASWIAFDPSGQYLYSTNEVADFGGASGSVSAYRVDRKSGDLTLLNVVSSEGAGPAHLSVDASGKYIFVANYAGGTVAVLPVLANGGLGAATYVRRDTGAVGPVRPENAPPGSFAFSGHDKPHAHMIEAAPGGRFVLHTDLGQDRIYVDRFDAGTGKLTPGEFPFASLPGGDGPRHFAFHSNGRWLYVLQEEASTVAFFHFNPETGALHAEQTVSSLPPGFKGTNFGSEILIAPDGRHVYAVNRLHNTVAVLAIGAEGRLAYLGETPTGGDYPRQIGIAPGGRFVYACNQRSDNVTCLKIDDKTGQLVSTGLYTAVGSPSCIAFLG